mmetsp:Transcript_14415/g.58786  ORF Transcript_14415/g.58786 Transcript_14415/m.58786 type:complete len:241 (-) Transcript_14415:1944-2666(-)
MITTKGLPNSRRRARTRGSSLKGGLVTTHSPRSCAKKSTSSWMTSKPSSVRRGSPGRAPRGCRGARTPRWKRNRDAPSSSRPGRPAVSTVATRADLIGSRTLVCACLLPRFQTTWSALVPGRTLYALWTVTSNRYLSAFHPATLLSMPSTIAAAPAHASLASAPGAGKGRRGGRLRDCSRACDARDCLSRGRRCSSRCATGKAVTHRASRARCGAGAEARGQDVQLSRACHRHGGIRAGG